MKTLTPKLHTKPGFEWDVQYGPGGFFRLVPVRVDHVWDTQTERYYRDAIHGGSFFAVARPERDPKTYEETGWWKVTTQCGHHGGRRHRFVKTREEAEDILTQWYARRFRYADQPRPSGTCACGKFSKGELDCADCGEYFNH